MRGSGRGGGVGKRHFPQPFCELGGGERDYHFPQPVHRSERFPSPSAETSPAPVETATKTIASFEALTPELFAPQGTLETDLGLPISLDVQFTGGAAGEVAVAWQCAAGYDPSAEAGGQFAFAAVLPEGYALLEGVSLPQILVTLTPRWRTPCWRRKTARVGRSPTTAR